MKTKFWLAGTLVLSLGSVGCNDKLEAKEVADVTASRSADMVRAVGASARVMNEMSAIKNLGSAATLLSDSFAGVPLAGLPGTCAEPGGDCSSELPEFSFEMDPAAVDAQAALVEKILRERIFTEANVESTDGDSTLFRLKGEALCSTGSAPASPACVQAANQLQLRIRATRSGKEGIDLGFQIGQNRDEPLVLKFAEKSIAVVMDLAETRSMVQTLAPEALPALPRVMVGKVELRLTENGKQDVTFSTSILDALRFELESNGDTHTFSTARASPLAELRMNAQDQRVSFALNLGTTEYSGPYGGTSALSRQKAVYSLSGLSYEFSAQEGQEDFAIAHVGLGEAQSYVSLNGTKLFTADLNALSGRHFDLSLAQGEGELPLIRVQPEFDLAASFFLAPLKADPQAEVPSFYEDQGYRVRLSGGGTPSIRPVAANAAKAFPGGLQVVSGELKLEGDGAAVTVPAGKCLVGQNPPANGSHPLLGHFASSDCP
ncbi:hypothetical protein [Stigmatella aurantiaca]|uniref:Conserved uncharacterized protein n=2 Tax=Stigmatella aurantiaca (strain DW4/3-1) TaxID=378806 RepID=E3FEY7_STIAD|nr:hypothetical protein [Stigmatella aurantiaca]ADO70168.1 conserved uncharacterized protein [Stigmatella aurantiaca DW4/3-1]